MSDVTVRRSRDEALWDAVALKELLEPFAEQWTVAGSIRRGLASVGDVDHVVVPKTEEVASGGLFGGEVEVRNLLWGELDRLVALEVDESAEDEFGLTEADYRLAVSKAIITDKNGRQSTRWGLRQRSVWFRGYVHEIYTTVPEAWGIALMIRTGPADFSRHVVTELRKHGYVAKDGRVWRVRGGDHAGMREAWLEPVAVETEREVFDLLGVAWRDPGDRNGRW